MTVLVMRNEQQALISRLGGLKNADNDKKWHQKAIISKDFGKKTLFLRCFSGMFTKVVNSAHARNQF